METIYFQVCFPDWKYKLWVKFIQRLFLQIWINFNPSMDD